MSESQACTAPHVLFAGRTTFDAVYWLDELPQEDTKVYAQAMRLTPGGPACNAAITCALLGGHATLMSAFGRGSIANYVRAELEDLGIRLLDLAENTEYRLPVPAVLVSRDRATRTIVNPPLQEAAICVPARWSVAWGEVPAVVLTDGFHLRETLPLLKACRDGGAQIVLDGGSWKPGTEALAPLLTAAICSERFAVPGDEAEAERTIRWFVEQGVPCIAVTRGARPIMAWERGRRFEIEIPPVNAVDTLGAGDVLHGAFSYELGDGTVFDAALRSAAKIATRSCESRGIRGWAEGGRPAKN